MSAFSSEKLIAVSVPDLAPVVDDLKSHFQERGYETVVSADQDGAHEVGITKGGMFKKVLGLRTALKIDLVPQPTGTLVRAGVGIFGKQVVPFVIAMLVTWPVLLTQMWGLISQAGLDDEAIKVAELSLNRIHRLSAGQDPAAEHLNFCHQCGHPREGDANFCTKCGTRSTSHKAAT
ncbi:zinc ribbon domain-containing protein [Streptomyces sp. W16]|uniref:zinc ribbon domain-containing protein n=1 Tax=Streptomyces sp. W16 TaxID=3076631 RepID=UPI00295BEC87|nr:zinc ribbon domain-containing protein [Streptomyces sp. W16]MDV9173846.1 zinc ribbon domain-containing protein [Streptomyces sp. W16]